MYRKVTTPGVHAKRKRWNGTANRQNSCGKDDASRGASFVSKKNKSPPPPSKEKEKMKQEGGMIAVTTYTGTFSLSSSISDAIRDGQQDTFVGQKGRSSFKKKKNIHYEYMKKIIKYMYFRKRLMFTEWFPKKKKKCFGL